MTGGRQAARRPTRAPLRRRSRQRWMVAGGVAACWLVPGVVTGSAVSATVALMLIAALTAAGVGGLRALGITRDHPWIRRIASRPWRDGQDVLKVVMRHLADVFVVPPSGALIRGAGPGRGIRHRCRIRRAGPLPTAAGRSREHRRPA